jgi:hypothetical protein
VNGDDRDVGQIVWSRTAVTRVRADLLAVAAKPLDARVSGSSFLVYRIGIRR